MYIRCSLTYRIQW